MRRSRISIKPNFRAGNRTSVEGEQASLGTNDVGDTLPAEEVPPSHQQNVAPKELSEDVGIKDATEMSWQINQTDVAPSSGATTSSAAPPRRMRISATPKLVRPKLTSTPRTQPSARMPSSAPLPNEEPVQTRDSLSEARASASIISNDLPESATATKSTHFTKPQPKTQSSFPGVPSTSGLRKSPVRGKKSVGDSPPSPQPGQVPHQPPQEPEPPECPSSSDLSSVSTMPSYCDKAGSSEMTEKSADQDRILRALKLKELMKLERRKDMQMGKRRVGHKEYTELDRSKMTMGDLIYYIPNTSPMRSSVEHEEDQTETIIPPSPKQQIKTTVEDEEEEEESGNEEMLVPKVRVAEDGSIILDEESLTVRVQRSSNTKVVESALFERGSTTTYSSFRTLNYVKSWSVRETDLFFLAISMVGTDFSLIGQLLTHRSRAAIKNKFKKEERVNPWRVDKALRNKRPYDKEFFSYLLERILAKDKDKRKSVKLIVPKKKKQRKSKVGDHEQLEDDDGNVSVEKENEDVSNVKESDASVPAKKRRKRTRGVSEDKDNDNSTEQQVKRKRQRKCRKKIREVQSSDDGENDLIEGDTISVNKEDELEKSTSASKRRRKRSENDKEERNEKPVKGTKIKKLKKSLKVVSDHDESVREHEESSIMDEDGSASKKKRKRAKNSDLDGDEPAKGKKNTKRKKALKSTVEEEGTAQEGEASAVLQEAEKLNAPVTAEVADNVPSKTTKRNKKPLPNLATTRSRKRHKPEASAEVEMESQDENNHGSILTALGSHLEDEKLQMQTVVVLEETPPRQQNLLSPSKGQCKNNEWEPSVSSPGTSSSTERSSTKQTRMQRAGRVKRDLSISGKEGRRKGMMNWDETEPDSPMVLLERITQESEDEEDDSLNEKTIDFSCLSDLHSQSFQRRPMVVLSREEVDVVLNASDSSADEDPSVSPLDLSINTELSFPFQCSRLLEDNNEEAEVDCVFEEHEERTNEEVSFEERNGEELELTESALAQLDMTKIRDISTTLNSQMYSQPEVALSKVTNAKDETEPQVHPVACKDVKRVAAVIEGSPPLVVLDNVDPICMKQDAPMTQETVIIETTTLGTSLVVSDAMEESVKTMLPTSLKEPQLASSEITEQSKLTPTGSGLGSQESLQATPEEKGELQTSLDGPSQTLETFQGSSESKDDPPDLPPSVASPEIKARKQGCAITPEVKEDSQEEVSVQSSSVSVSSEHGVRPTRRSRFLKPKPNFSPKSRVSVLQNQRQDLKSPSTFKPKSSEPISPEKLLHSPAADQHGALEDLNNEGITNEEETSESNAVDQRESESTKDLSDPSAVTDQGTITAITLSPASADEPRVASENQSSRREVDMILPCTTLILPQPSQAEEDTDSGQMTLPSVDVCASAEILHVNEECHDDDEPTFILTLFEIPVTQAYLPSSTDSAMTSDLPAVGTQSSLGFSDEAHTLPSTSESYRIDSLPMENSGTEKVYSQNDVGVGTEQISEHSTSHEITLPQTKDEGIDMSANLEMGIPSLDPNSESKKGIEFASLDDLSPRIQSTPSVFSVSKCITALPQDQEDIEQCDRVSHMVLDDVFVPVSGKTGDDSNKDRAIAVECKLESNEASAVSLTDLAESGKEKTTSLEPISPDTKDEESGASANLETGIPHMDPNSECQKGSEPEDLSSRTQSTPSGFNISKCITTLYEDTEQSERVFVPVSEETGDDSSKDRTMDVECKLESNEASSASVTEDLAENVKEQISEHMNSHQPILLDTKDEESDACADLEMGIPHLDPHSECTKSSGIATYEDLLPRNQNMPFAFSVSKCVKPLPRDPQDTEQCDRVSHMMLGDVFVHVSGETEDDSSKDTTMDVECKRHSKEASTDSLPERQDTSFEELTTVDNSPANPLLSIESTEQSKDTPLLSEEKKTSARRRARQKVKPQPKLVKRACAKDESSKTDQLVKEPNQPTSSRVVLSAFHEEKLAGVSHTTEEKTVDRMSTRRGNKTSVSRSKEVKPKTNSEESPRMSQGDVAPTESKPTSTALNLPKEPTPVEENSENVTGDTTIKDDLASSAEDKELLILSSEGANVRPCCEEMHFNLIKASGSGSSTVDSEETEADTQGVAHIMLPPDVFVLVSDVTEDDLSNTWTVSDSPQRVSLPKKSDDHIQKEIKTEDVSQTLTEESTQNQSPFVDIKTPVRKRGKQEVKRTCNKNDSPKIRLSPPTPPQATTPPSQPSPLSQNENVLLEETLQRKHHIMPCTVRLSSLDNVAQSLSVSEHQLGDRKNTDESTVMGSPTCHSTVTSLSVESSTPSLFKEMTLKDPELEKKSRTRSKGKKHESSPHTKHGHFKPVSQTRQLTITDWARKKSQSSLKAIDAHQLMAEKACSKSQTEDSEEPECSHLVPALEETEEASSISKEMKRPSEVVKESAGEPSVSRVKKAPAGRRAKLQVKPILSKRACNKSESNASTTDQPQPSRFTSPTRQHARAAREKEESDNKTKQPVKDVSNTSSMKANSKSTECALITSGSQSPKSQDTWPRVVLPRVKLWTTEAGVCSASSTPTSSPARVTESASSSVTPPQLKKSPTQSSSPTANENADPSRVSQFFLCDIFTEVEEAE